MQSSDNTADILTKPLGCMDFLHLHYGLGLCGAKVQEEFLSRCCVFSFFFFFSKITFLPLLYIYHLLLSQLEEECWSSDHNTLSLGHVTET